MATCFSILPEKNAMDRGACQATGQRVIWSDTVEQLSAFPGGSDGKGPASNAGDLGLICGLERSPGEGNGYLLQYSCLGNPMDGGAWQVTVHGVTESDTTEQQTLSLPLSHIYNGILLQP